jgi:hypothetical protein
MGQVAACRRHRKGSVGLKLANLRVELMTSPDLEFVFELRVDIGPTVAVGTTPSGLMCKVFILGGTFSGPQTSGRILPSGANRRRPQFGKSEVEFAISQLTMRLRQRFWRWAWKKLITMLGISAESSQDQRARDGRTV